MTPAQPDWPYWTEPSWVDVDGVKTAYRRQGSGHPLVFLHPALMTRVWLPFYEELSRHFDVIVPEHPGFGDTATPDWLRSFEDLVLHYDGFLRELQVDDPHLVGHSLGGWLAADLAITYPDRFRSLTLITPQGLRLPEAPVRDPFRISPEDALQRYLNGTADDYADYVKRESDLESTLHEYSESITLARLAWNPRYDHRLDRRLQRLHAPTLIVAAEDDRFVPRAHAERWAELIDAARLEVLPGTEAQPTGHLLTIQQPTPLAALIAAHAQTAEGAD